MFRRPSRQSMVKKCPRKKAYSSNQQSPSRAAGLLTTGLLDRYAAPLQGFTQQDLDLGIDATHVGCSAPLHRFEQ
jgi:hypothetical protein